MLVLALFLGHFSLPTQALMTSGKVTVAPECTDTQTEVFVEFDELHRLIHQFTVPKNGNFSIDLKSGAYRMSAIGNKKCFGMVVFHAPLDPQKIIELKITPKKE